MPRLSLPGRFFNRILHYFATLKKELSTPIGSTLSHHQIQAPEDLQCQLPTPREYLFYCDYNIYCKDTYTVIGSQWHRKTCYTFCVPPPVTDNDPRYPDSSRMNFNGWEDARAMALYCRYLNRTAPEKMQDVVFQEGYLADLSKAGFTFLQVAITEYMCTCAPEPLRQQLGRDYIYSTIYSMRFLTVAGAAMAGLILQKIDAEDLAAYMEIPCIKLHLQCRSKSVGEMAQKMKLGEAGHILILAALLAAIAWDDDAGSGFNCKHYMGLKIPPNVLSRTMTALLEYADWNLLQFEVRGDLQFAMAQIVESERTARKKSKNI